MLYHGKAIYQEDALAGNPYRQRYVDSIDNLVDRMEMASYQAREAFMPTSELVQYNESYRRKYYDMLGYPLTGLSGDARQLPDARQEFVARDDFCDIYRIDLETMPDFHFYGILMIPHGVTQGPLAIAQHGGRGTPELCSDLNGKNNYSHFTKILLERGCVVFAPQLLLWNIATDWDSGPIYQIPYDRQKINEELKHLGSGIVALEIYCLIRSIDYLQSLDCVDPTRIGMTGNSYGGFYALYTMAADTRIQAGYACGFFNDRNRVFLSDWRWQNSGHTLHDAEVAALCAPRQLILDVGMTDPVFDYRPAVAEAERIPKYYAAFGALDKFTFNLWPGGHRIDVDSDGFDRFFAALRV